ncbi:Pyrroline-5-carboxylate reductase [Seminavis robusta]|uniref:Pyrroline-5-carboxylate reductase n=1 Tax=Seminavis robusta TaxID=568900 RepID=A0A9N8HUX4_9STRA|nr:Pyrroline-5-carboxylate reductase [Seminavis robusta]|eukprot:Sro1439_g272780.1 Pyrroline-5-carboxylate reductase (390) ;mRNA; f:7855-9134
MMMNPRVVVLVSARTGALRSTSSRCMSSLASSGTFFPKTNTDALLRKKSSTTTTVSNDAAFDKIAFLGVGNMAQAILNPLISTGLQPADQITLMDANPSTLQQVTEQHPTIQTADSIASLLQDADLVVCAIKPQNITPTLLQEIQATAPNRPDHATFLSVIAGVSIDTYVPTGYDKIVRSMPNTPAMIGRGMTVWCSTNSLTAKERNQIEFVLQCLGETMYVDDERQIDMSTAISGSAPAYVFMLMEDMIEAGVHMGYPRDKATKLVYQTLLGSTLYAMETGEHPAILRNNVTSPNGTTASAIYELENGGFRTAVKDAMWGCYRRSLEMGGHESNVGPGRAPVLPTEERILEQLLDPANPNTDYMLTIEKKPQQEKGDTSSKEEERWAA